MSTQELSGKTALVTGQLLDQHRPSTLVLNAEAAPLTRLIHRKWTAFHPQASAASTLPALSSAKLIWPGGTASSLRTMSMLCYGRAPAVRQPAWYPVRASTE